MIFLLSFQRSLWLSWANKLKFAFGQVSAVYAVFLSISVWILVFLLAFFCFFSPAITITSKCKWEYKSNMRQTRQQLTYLHTHLHTFTHTQTDDCVCCSKNNKWESHSCLPFQLKCAHICTGDTAKKWKKGIYIYIWYTISICIWHTHFNLCYNFLVLCAFWGVAKKLARRNGEPHTRTPICHGGW